MESNQTQRIWVIVAFLFIGVVAISGRLIWLQLVKGSSMVETAAEILHVRDKVQPERGFILDRNGVVLAAPGNDFALGVDVPFLAKVIRDGDGNVDKYEQGEEVRQALIVELARILQDLDEGRVQEDRRYTFDEIKKKIDLVVAQEGIFAPLSLRISSEHVAKIEALDYRGIVFDPIPRRLYPQGKLMCHVLGYVDYDEQGNGGVESWWDATLAGEAVLREYENVPLIPREEVNAREGADLVLTIDRSVQAAVERQLQAAITTYAASGGEIIVMNPQTGEILAMADSNCYDPYTYFEVPAEGRDIFINPSISKIYEPGSVMKLITMAIGLDSGTVTPGTIYQDNGIIFLGGIPIRNAEEKAYGPIDMTGVLVNSVNTATAWVSTLIGSEKYYTYMDRFGFGRATEIDIAQEARGYVPEPGNVSWTEATLATNGFGQGVSVTPLQMLSAIAAIANGGQQMQPYVVKEIHKADGEITPILPRVISNPITQETAQLVTTMAIKVAANYFLEVPGYTIAGKTGTAQIPVVEVVDDVTTAFYHPDDTIASFVGWLPADDPAFVVIVKLDVPTVSEWGSETAAPTFVELAKELVVLLDVPPDSVRFATR